MHLRDLSAAARGMIPHRQHLEHWAKSFVIEPMLELYGASTGGAAKGGRAAHVLLPKPL